MDIIVNNKFDPTPIKRNTNAKFVLPMEYSSRLPWLTKLIKPKIKLRNESHIKQENASLYSSNLNMVK